MAKTKTSATKLPTKLKLLPGGSGTTGHPYVIMAVPIKKNARAVAWVYDSKELAEEIVRRYNDGDDSTQELPIITLRELETELRGLRARREYEELGAILWEIFVIRSKTDPMRKLASKFWMTLSKAEQTKCEEL